MVRILLQGDAYLAKDSSAKLLCEILNEKEAKELTISKDSFYKIIPLLINGYNETIQEYTVINSKEVKIREGSPGNWSDYLEYLEPLVSTEEVPRIGSVLLEKRDTLKIKVLSVSTIDKKANLYTFADNELFTNLSQTIHDQNIREIIYTDDLLTKLFISLGIVHYKVPKPSQSPLNPSDILEKHLNINLSIQKYEITEASLKDRLRMDKKAADALLSGEIRIEDEINCITPQGKRLLKMYIRSPSTNIQEIQSRQNTVTALLSKTTRIRTIIKGIPDTYTVAKNSSILNISSILRIYRSITQTRILLSNTTSIEALSNHTAVLEDSLEYIKDLVVEIEGIVDITNQTINQSSSKELSHLIDHLHHKENELFQEYARETEQIQNKTKHKIKHKLENSPLFGYCIKIPRTEESVLTNQHKLTVNKTGILFTTEPIKEINREIKEIRNKIEIETTSILKGLTDSIRLYKEPIELINHTVAVIDVYTSLAEYAINNSLTCPIFNSTNSYVVKNTYHPLLPTIHRRHTLLNRYTQEIVKNTLEIEERRFCIITGPNMGGKTTFLKTVGIVTILAQIGSYVPAEYASLPIFKQLFIRIGASDNPDKGISTFMAEMIDMSNILNQATDDSLVIIDELGRGTSDEDGYAIAASTVEYLSSTKGVCLFSTHFHRLLDIPGILIKRVGSIKKNNKIVMTYKIEDGVSEVSHGINTARVMGFPEEVISHAERILQGTDKKKIIDE